MKGKFRLTNPWMPLTEDELENGVEYSERAWELMRLPNRLRLATIGGISNEKLHHLINSYLSDLRNNRFEGTGIFLSGSNGVGKSMALSIVLRAYYAHDQTSIYTTAFEILQSKLDGKMYTSDYRLCDYAKKCDVLFIDELGSEHKSKSNFDSYALEDLVRSRYADNKVSLFATNYTHNTWRERYRESLWTVVENASYCLTFEGRNRRKDQHKSDS